MTPEQLAAAACRDIDPETMFPLSADDAGVAAAKAVCNGCPVKGACGDYATGQGIAYGIWGGMTEDERRTRRAATAQPARPTAKRVDHTQVGAAAAGRVRYRDLTLSERIDLWRQHRRAGGGVDAFARQHGLSWTALRALRRAAAEASDQSTPNQAAA